MTRLRLTTGLALAMVPIAFLAGSHEHLFAGGCDANCPRGLSGWWPAEGSAQDALHSNGGTLVNGASFTSGTCGEAFNFDGFDDYVNIPDAPEIFFADNQPFTLEAWFLAASETPSYFVLKNAAYGLKWQGRDAPLLFYNGNNHYSSKTSWEVNRWYHVAMVDDGAESVKLYIDGDLDRSEEGLSRNPNRFPCRPIFGYCFDLQFGAWYEPAACSGNCIQFFHGLVDDVRLYGRALAADELADRDHDGERDVCDLDDGVILVELPDDTTVLYQLEAGFGAFNVYRGAMSALVDTGEYTQDPSLAPTAAHFCAQSAGIIAEPFTPAAGTVVYYLCAGVVPTGEGSLGLSSDGNQRSNHNPCPEPAESYGFRGRPPSGSPGNS